MFCCVSSLCAVCDALPIFPFQTKVANRTKYVDFLKQSRKDRLKATGHTFFVLSLSLLASFARAIGMPDLLGSGGHRKHISLPDHGLILSTCFALAQVLIWLCAMQD